VPGLEPGRLHHDELVVVGEVRVAALVGKVVVTSEQEPLAVEDVDGRRVPASTPRYATGTRTCFWMT